MKIRGNKIVALFDILGTKKRIENVGIDGVLGMYEKLAEFVDQQTGSLVVRSVPAGDGTFCPAVGYLEVEKAYFSDSFIIWADHDAFRIPAFMQMCIDLFCFSLDLGIPMRGGIGVGDTHMDKERSIYLGPALIDAAESEAAQRWLGISCGRSFNNKKYGGPFDPRLLLVYKKQQHPAKNYELPGLVLDWPRCWRETRKDDAKVTLNTLNTDSSFSDYYTCAQQYVDFSLLNHDWFLKGSEMKT